MRIMRLTKLFVPRINLHMIAANLSRKASWLKQIAKAIGGRIGSVARRLLPAYIFLRDDFVKVVVSTVTLFTLALLSYHFLKPNVTVIEPFQVPSDLAAQGLNGQAVASKLLDEINRIRARRMTARIPRGYIAPGALTQPYVSTPQEFEVTVQGISLSSLVQYVDLELGRDIRIAGEVFRQKNEFYATLRISNYPGQVITVVSPDSFGLFRHLAVHVLKVSDPITLLDFYHSVQDWPAALELVGHLLRTSTSKSELKLAYNFWGLVLSAQKHHETAIEKFKRATEIDDDAAFIYVNWANTLKDWGQQTSNTGKYEEAIKLLEQASRISPRMAAIYIGWGQILQNQHKYEEAIDKFMIAAKVDPRFASFAYESIAQVLEDQGKISEAIEKYQEAIKITPGQFSAYVNLAQMLATQGRYADGYKRLEEASVIDPHEATVQLAWGMMLSNQKKLKQAFTRFENAAGLNPRFDEPHFQLGATLFELHDYKAAIAHLEHAAKLSPNRPDTYEVWAHALLKLQLFDEAIRKLEMSKSLNPASAPEIDPRIQQFYLVWGIQLRDRRHYVEAIAKFKQSTEVGPRFGAGFFEWGMTLSTMKEFGQAITQFQNAYEADPTLSDALLNWGRSLLEVKRYDDAVVRLTAVLEKSPHSSNAYYFLGVAYKALGRTKDARDSLEKYLKAEPNGPYAKEVREFLSGGKPQRENARRS